MQKFNREIVSLMQLRNLEQFIYAKGGHIDDVVNQLGTYKVTYTLPNDEREESK